MRGRTGALTSLDGDRLQAAITHALRAVGYHEVLVGRLIDSDGLSITAAIDAEHWERHSWPFGMPLEQALARFTLVQRQRLANEQRAIEPHPINWEDL